VANELNATPSKLPPTRAYMLEAARETRDLDRHAGRHRRAAYPSLPYDPTYRAFDVLGVNSYFGWYPGKPTGRPARSSRRGHTCANGTTAIHARRSC